MLTGFPFRTDACVIGCLAKRLTWFKVNNTPLWSYVQHPRTSPTATLIGGKGRRPWNYISHQNVITQEWTTFGISDLKKEFWLDRILLDFWTISVHASVILCQMIIHLLKSIFPPKLFFRPNIPLPVFYPINYSQVIHSSFKPDLFYRLSTSFSSILSTLALWRLNPLHFPPLQPCRGHLSSSHKPHNISTKNYPPAPPVN